ISQGLENVVGMNFGGTFEYEGIKITMVPSSHSSGYNSNGDVLYLGNPGGYVIEFPDGNILYHCGDTGVSADMKIIADLFQPKIGMLAIGGHYTMDSIGAAYAAQLLGLKSIIPIHYGTFPILAGNPNDLTHALDGTGIAVHAINPGESVNFKPIKEDTTMFA
ncbi:MAG: metal-dependent hydrolase, partial [Candidatus Heimdallarchaeota archaeon]|nr:metal-dependent hydrolase [Candidatus Heimdallarchaeota archaeon]